MRTRADACSPESVGVDTSHFNTYFPVYLGSAYGQVFEARDTVLQAVSVWRDYVPNATPLRLYVMELDSTGAPDFLQILRYGPTLQIVGDGVHPVLFRFVLDPPLFLPRRGHYEFAVQVAPPVCDGEAVLLGDTRDPYSGGTAWRHSRTLPGAYDCPLGPARPVDPSDDLIFLLEFCDTDATPVAVTEGLPATFVLYQNQPNPFAASTTFRFDLPGPETVRLEVFDLMGRSMATVRDAWMPAGRHSLEWNSRDAGGSPVPPGAYVYRISAGSFRAHRKLVVLP